MSPEDVVNWTMALFFAAICLMTVVGASYVMWKEIQ